MRALILLCTLSAAAFAQVDTNVITVTASRQLNSQPDQVTVGVTVTTDEAQTLDKVLAALPGSFTAANLAEGLGYGTGQVQWIFTLTAPITNLPSTIAALGAPATTKGAFRIDYYVEGSSQSAQAATSQQCPYPALISDARAQAGKLAVAAGVKIGPIVTLVPGTTLQAPLQSPLTVARIGDFSGFLLGTPALWVDPTIFDPLVNYPTPSCFLTVQFQISQ